MNVLWYLVPALGFPLAAAAFLAVLLRSAIDRWPTDPAEPLREVAALRAQLAAQPDAPGLDACDPEASDPEASDPEASDPEASDPEASDPEASDPEASGHKASDLAPSGLGGSDRRPAVGSRP